jgi:hypothetical protein
VVPVKNPSPGPAFFNEISAVPVVPVVPAKNDDWKTRIPHHFFLYALQRICTFHINI